MTSDIVPRFSFCGYKHWLVIRCVRMILQVQVFLYPRRPDSSRVYAHMHVRICTDHTHTHIYIYIYVHILTCTQTNMYMYACICTCTCICICICICMHVCTVGKLPGISTGTLRLTPASASPCFASCLLRHALPARRRRAPRMWAAMWPGPQLAAWRRSSLRGCQGACAIKAYSRYYGYQSHTKTGHGTLFRDYTMCPTTVFM